MSKCRRILCELIFGTIVNIILIRAMILLSSYGKAKSFGINVMYAECVAEFSDR